MPAVAELNAERKKRARVRQLKRMALLFVLCLLILAAVYVQPMLEGLSASDLFLEAFATVGKTGSFPVSLVGETARSIEFMNGSVAVLTDSNVQVYSRAGRSSATVQNGFAGGVCRVSGSRGVLYGAGAKRLILFGKGGAQGSVELDYNIISAAVSASGRVAAITYAERHAASVRVFDAKFTPLFTWYSAENQAVALDFSPDANRLCVATIAAEGGGLVSAIKQFSIAGQSELGETRLPETLLVALRYTQEGVLAVGDDRMVYVDEAGALKGSYSYQGKPIARYSLADTGAALALGDYTSERQVSVVSLAKDCTVNFALVVKERILDLFTDGNFTYVLTDSVLSVYNQSGALVNSYPNDSGAVGVTAGGESVYLLMPHLVKRLT